jgi:hypothetical protein
MKNRISVSVLTMLLFCSVAFAAKNPADISATVKDSQTKQAIEFATVELLSTKDSLLAGCITDSKGYFEIAPPLQTAKLRIRYMGYKTLDVPFKDRDLGTLLLEEDARQLKEVSVKGSAHQNKIDRDVYNVTKELRAGTTSSQELLGKLNGVNYNRYDKSISVNGSTKVLILIDGVEKNQQLAKTLPPERIERVEVIKDPVGKYATDGYSAVINIVLKKDFSGVDAYISNTAFFDLAGTNGSDKFVQDFGNMNITYTYKNLNVYASGWGYGNQLNLPFEYVKRYGNVTTNTPSFDFDNPNSKLRQKNADITLGADYTFAKKHTLSAEFNYSGNNNKNSFWYDLTNSVNGSPISNSSSFNSNNSTGNNLQGTVTYKGKFDEKNSLDADVRYRHTSGTSDNMYQQDSFSSISNIDQSGDYTRVNINYTHQFSPSLSTDLGYGNVFNQSVNKQNGSSFTRNEYRNRVSLYVSYKPFEKLNTKVGGIVENYTQSFDGSSKNLTSVLPYINIQYVASPKFNIVAKYHSWADYPSIDQLTPYKTVVDSLMWSIGNPSLKTAIYHTLGLEFHIMNFINISPYYSYDDTRIASYVSKADDNIHYVTQNVNADKYKRYGITMDFTLPLSKSIFWQNWMDWYKNTLSYNGESGTTHNFVLNSTLVYMAPKAGIVTGAVLQKQISREATIQGYSSGGNDIALLFFQKSLLKQKLNITLLYMLPVKMGLTYEQGNLTQTPSYYQLSHTSLNLIKNLAFIEINYHFNAGRQVTKKTANNDDDNKNKKKGGFGL